MQRMGGRTRDSLLTVCDCLPFASDDFQPSFLFIIYINLAIPFIPRFDGFSARWQR